MALKPIHPYFKSERYVLRITRIAFLCFTAACLAVLLNELRIPSVELGLPQNIEDPLIVASTLHNSGRPIKRRGISLERANTSASTHPSKRALAFNDAVKKGSGYLCRMNVAAPAPGVTIFPPQSQFLLFADLLDNGWSSAPYPLTLHDSIPELQPALNFLGLANNLGSTTPRGDQHDTNYDNSEGQTTKPTGAWGQNLYNVDDGYIIAESNRSPAQSPNPNNIELPALEAWSDVAFLEWQNLAGQNIQNIQYIFQFDVTNDDTNAIVDQAVLNVDPLGIGGFPGHVLLMSTANGQAVLGTPNGNGGAWLLATHKAKFGLKTIESVRVWAVGDELEKTVLAFEVVNV